MPVGCQLGALQTNEPLTRAESGKATARERMAESMVYERCRSKMRKCDGSKCRRWPYVYCQSWPVETQWSERTTSGLGVVVTAGG